MSDQHQYGPRLRAAILAGGLLLITLIIAAPFMAEDSSAAASDAAAATGAYWQYIPMVPEQVKQEPLCRFGVNVVSNLDVHDTGLLRMGWYVDYQANQAPHRPNGADYMPIISLSQVGENGYSYTPNGAALQAAIAANPGAAWFIGNEPDRKYYQNDLEPHVYAAVYHELYELIKAADPSAQIFAGTIVQPTPIRLQYLDMVLDSYEATHGQPMPVDGWSIHNFILNEVNCDYDPDNCWGADVPPGIDVPHGEILTIEDNDNMVLFVERVERFRQWMADRGYGGLPVYLSEYGVLMPDWLGFDAARVNTFMNSSFDYMLSATDPVLGDPNDGYRLIQRFSWYSTADTNYNGALFDPNTNALSAIGANYAAYTADLPGTIDLYPSQIDAVASGSGLTLSAVIANSGNLTEATGPVNVRFYKGNPAAGGVQIGTTQTASLSGCGDNQMVQVIWNSPPAGSQQIYVSVDPDGRFIETDEGNNVANETIVVD